MRWRNVLTVFGGFVACLFPVAAQLRVACVGDSITQGVGAEKGQSYPQQLQRLLGEQWNVGNFGVSGRTLLKKGDFPYWAESAYRDALAFKPDAVVIMLGTNDSKPQNWSHEAEFVSDYRELVASFSQLPSHPQVFVCRPCPVPEPGNWGINETVVREQIRRLDEFARELKLPVIDIHAALTGRPELLPDRVHPNTEGAAVMAQTVFAALKQHVPDQIKRESWHGATMELFQLAGRDCRVVVPAKPAKGMPWLWRPEFFDAFHDADLALLAQGYHLCYVDLKNSFGCPDAIARMEVFHRVVTQMHGLNQRAWLVGLSRGGLYSLNFAIKRPDWVMGVYLDAPVCDFRSWPGGRGKSKGSPEDWQKLKQDYGFESDEQALRDDVQPMQHLAPMVAAGIPLLVVTGDADQTVPHLENAVILQQKYRALGGSVELMVKPGADHHPHGLPDPTAIVNFVQTATAARLR